MHRSKPPSLKERIKDWFIILVWCPIAIVFIVLPDIIIRKLKQLTKIKD